MEFLEECASLLAEGWIAIFKVAFLVLSIPSGVIGIALLLASFSLLLNLEFGAFVVGIIASAVFLVISFFGFVMYKFLSE